ncbi:cytochrome P450 [Kitasatospora sp. NPDC049258]|uniref:cytochrome P450 n=1 Tax=Kitasatospora sp. NPDC049258 TaxID=3155394 RepID=UPI00343B5ADE
MDGTAVIEQLLTPEGRADPYPLYELARELGPVAPCGEGLVLVTGYQEADRALRDPAFAVQSAARQPGVVQPLFPSPARELFARSLLETDAPDHTRVRALIASVFTARRVAALAPAVAAAVARLLEQLAGSGTDGSPVDFMDGFAFRLPVGVVCELLGVPEQDHYRFRGLASDLTAALELEAEPAELDAADAAAEELGDYFLELAARRVADPRDDLVGALVQVAAADGARLGGDELIANLVVLLVAGFETTTNLLGNGLRLLFDHPELITRLRGGGLAPGAFTEEVLRFDPPVQLTTRIARGDGLALGGVPVPPGTGVLLLLGAANRDPARYPQPDRFDPDRFDPDRFDPAGSDRRGPAGRPLSFGAGAHFCLGARLARLEADLALPALLTRFPALAPAAAPLRRERLVLRGYRSLPVSTV